MVGRRARRRTYLSYFVPYFVSRCSWIQQYLSLVVTRALMWPYWSCRPVPVPTFGSGMGQVPAALVACGNEFSTVLAQDSGASNICQSYFQLLVVEVFVGRCVGVWLRRPGAAGNWKQGECLRAEEGRIAEQYSAPSKFGEREYHTALPNWQFEWTVL